MVCQARYFDLWADHIRTQARLKRCLFRAMGHNQSMRLAVAFERWRSCAVQVQLRAGKQFRVMMRLESLLIGRAFDAWRDMSVVKLRHAAVREKIEQSQVKRAMAKWMKRAELAARQRQSEDADAAVETERLALATYQIYVASKNAHRNCMVCQARYFDLWADHIRTQARLKRCLFRCVFECGWWRTFRVSIPIAAC